MPLTRKKVDRSIVLASAAFFASMLAPRPATVLPAGLDALRPSIEALYDAGLYSRAIEALQAAFERNPTDASLYYWLGRCLYEIRDFSRSISSFERAIALTEPLS